jgi:hypothetical protein
MKKFYLATLLLFAVTPMLYAQINEVKLLTAKPSLYKKAEWAIKLKETWENPYLQEDVALDMWLTSPSGKKLILPCYFESGESGKESIWKARFAPQEIGKYEYVFHFSKAGSVIIESKPGVFVSSASNANGFLHGKNNWTFQFDNGKPFRGIGENIGWESRANDDSKFFKKLHENPKYNYEDMLRLLAAHGGNYFRTWVSAFNLPVDWKKPGNSNRYTPTTEYFNPSAIKKMDRMITLSDSLGLYVMLTLGQGASSVRDGGFSPSSADFFVNPKSKARYKNRLRYFVARWGYSTSIGAWEFFNEVDNVQFNNRPKPISADSIVQWHDEMSTYLKQLDPYNHLVTTSISHRDLKGLNSLQHIDFNQKHVYRNTISMPASIVKYEDNFKKPYVIGEFSYEWDWSKNFDDFADGMDSDFKRGMWYGLFAPTPVLPMTWWWEYFDNRGTDAYLVKVREISDKMMAAGKGSFERIAVKNNDSTNVVYGVKCGNNVFVYAYNPGAEAKDIALEFNAGSKVKQQLTRYDCETGKYSKPIFITPSSGKVNISKQSLAAKTDAIFIISTPQK